jgi:transposase
LSERCLNLTGETVTWPATSPDLNPQEQMWAILRKRINFEGCTTPEELYARAVSVWDAIPVENRQSDH